MKLSKQMKKFVIILSIILLLIFSVCALFELKTTKYEEKQEVYYAYQSKGSVDYTVFFRTNVMYDQSYMEKDRYYVFKYIDHVELKFKYQFKGSDPAQLKTNYLVKAYLQGLHGKENEVLWSKEYVLVPQQVEQEENTDRVIEITVPVTLDSYWALKETIFNDSEVNSPVVLNVFFDVRTLASTPKGTLEDKMSPNIIIPIGENVFKIEAAPEISGENSIAETIKVQMPVDMRKISIYFAISFIFLIMAVLLALFIKVAVPPDTFDRTMARIFKEYGERLAGMEQAISYQLANIVSVTSIEDMVKIADEVGQPVFYYKVNSPLERKIEFYVFDSGRVYYMVMFGEIKPAAESPIQVESGKDTRISM